MGSIKLATDNEALSSSQLEGKVHNCMGRLSHFRAQSLPHLLALLLRPPPGFPPEGTSLLIVDSVSSPFSAYFPNATELRSRLAQGRIADNQQLQWLLNRKWNVTSDMANQLVKLAAARRLAVVLLNQTHTKIKGQPRATLYPALAGGSWETCIHARIVLYRDLPPEEGSEAAADREALKYVRLAEVMKRDGKVLSVRTDDNIVPFLIESVSNGSFPTPHLLCQRIQLTIDQDGLREIRKNESRLPDLTSSSSPQASIPVQPQPQPQPRRKRKVDEIADSEDEDEDDSDGDYGWMESDDAHLLAEEEAEAETGAEAGAETKGEKEEKEEKGREENA